MTVLAEISFAEPNPPTTIEAIREVERHFDIVFPEDYKAFLLTYNGGYRPDRSNIIYTLPDDKIGGSIAESFWGVFVTKGQKLTKTDIDFWGLETYRRSVDLSDYSMAIFPIAMNPGAGEFCIGVKPDEPHFGKVFFHDNDAWDDDGKLEIEFLEALDMTFSEFLNNLMTRDDADKLEGELKRSNKP